MRHFLSHISGILLALLSLQGHAQPEPHLGAETALKGIVLEQDFGNNLELHSREVVTMAVNSKVKGLNGLLFMRWKGMDPSMEIVASVQWFEDTYDLLVFYNAEKARRQQGLLPIGDTLIWKTGESGFLWTDGQNFVVSLGGSPAPPQEMLEAWQQLIDSNPPSLAHVPKPQS